MGTFKDRDNLDLVLHNHVVCTGVAEQLGRSSNNELESYRESYWSVEQVNAWTPLEEQKDNGLKYSTVPFPKTALASFPGSGNTWTRHLMEQVSGYYTGSIYRRSILFDTFPGEKYDDGRCVAIKTHSFDTDHVASFQRSVVIIRNPYDCLVSEFHREATMDKLGVCQEGDFSTPVWDQYVTEMAEAWYLFHKYWLDVPYPLHVTTFENIKKDTLGEMKKIVNFLELDWIESRESLLVTNKKGSFQRIKPQKKTSNEDRFSSKQREVIEHYKMLLNSTLDKYAIKI